MPRQRINEQQVRLYMSSRNEGKTQVTASAKAGISERSGRRIEKEEIRPWENRDRQWRTREDPFEKVWERMIVPMLEETPSFTPQTLFEYLQREYPGQYPDSKLRTFQRRVKTWKALHGKDKEVMFLQNQQIGRMGLSDFTSLKDVEITINGEVLDHLLYHFRLAFSGWCDAKVVLGGESYTALSEGMQNALWKLGGVPDEHRTDSLSAAFRNVSKDAADDMTRRYNALCDHYGMTVSRNNRGCGHENGAVESPHGHLKRRIRQGFLLRGSNDFESVDAYQQWINGVTKEINGRKQDRIDLERPRLNQLPLTRTSDYTEKVVRVTTSSTIATNRVLYTVPSRLIGEKLRLHIFDDHIDGFVGTSRAVTLPRVYAPDNNHRGRRIDYRHVIESLERKPQAFRYSQIRDDLLPDERYRQIWQWVDQELAPRAACKMMVGILALAHRFDCEDALANQLITLKLNARMPPALHELQEQFGKKSGEIPEVVVKRMSASDYDHLLSGRVGKVVRL